jgi:site-specific recombinase XerC
LRTTRNFALAHFLQRTIGEYRYPLSPRLAPLKAILAKWRAARKKGWMPPGQPWLFPGYRGQHMSARQLHRVVRWAAARAGVTKRVGVHTLRHSFATHLPEQKTDIRIIQSLPRRRPGFCSSKT